MPSSETIDAIKAEIQRALALQIEQSSGNYGVNQLFNSQNITFTPRQNGNGFTVTHKNLPGDAFVIRVSQGDRRDPNSLHLEVERKVSKGTDAAIKTSLDPQAKKALSELQGATQAVLEQSLGGVRETKGGQFAPAKNETKTHKLNDWKLPRLEASNNELAQRMDMNAGRLSPDDKTASAALSDAAGSSAKTAEGAEFVKAAAENPQAAQAMAMSENPDGLIQEAQKTADARASAAARHDPRYDISQIFDDESLTRAGNQALLDDVIDNTPQPTPDIAPKPNTSPQAYDISDVIDNATLQAAAQEQANKGILNEILDDATTARVEAGPVQEPTIVTKTPTPQAEAPHVVAAEQTAPSRPAAPPASPAPRQPSGGLGLGASLDGSTPLAASNTPTPATQPGSLGNTHLGQPAQAVSPEINTAQQIEANLVGEGITDRSGVKLLEPPRFTPGNEAIVITVARNPKTAEALHNAGYDVRKAAVDGPNSNVVQVTISRDNFTEVWNTPKPSTPAVSPTAPAAQKPAAASDQMPPRGHDSIAVPDPAPDPRADARKQLTDALNSPSPSPSALAAEEVMTEINGNQLGRAGDAAQNLIEKASLASKLGKLGTATTKALPVLGVVATGAVASNVVLGAEKAHAAGELTDVQLAAVIAGGATYTGIGALDGFSGAAAEEALEASLVAAGVPEAYRFGTTRQDLAELLKARDVYSPEARELFAAAPGSAKMAGYMDDETLEHINSVKANIVDLHVQARQTNDPAQKQALLEQANLQMGDALNTAQAYVASGDNVDAAKERFALVEQHFAPKASQIAQPAETKVAPPTPVQEPQVSMAPERPITPMAEILQSADVQGILARAGVTGGDMVMDGATNLNPTQVAAVQQQEAIARA